MFSYFSSRPRELSKLAERGDRAKSPKLFIYTRAGPEVSNSREGTLTSKAEQSCNYLGMIVNIRGI